MHLFCKFVHSYDGDCFCRNRRKIKNRHRIEMVAVYALIELDLKMVVVCREATELNETKPLLSRFILCRPWILFKNKTNRSRIIPNRFIWKSYRSLLFSLFIRTTCVCTIRAHIVSNLFSAIGLNSQALLSFATARSIGATIASDTHAPAICSLNCQTPLYVR